MLRAFASEVNNAIQLRRRLTLVVLAIRSAIPDAISWLSMRFGEGMPPGFGAAAEIAAAQARLVGSIQYPMVTGDLKRAAAALRELAPTYELLRFSLA